MPEVIDIDALSDPPSDDSEIEFMGFRRDPSKSKMHTEELDADGITYIGFKEIAKRAASVSKDAPPAKRHKPTPQPPTTNPHLKRPRIQTRATPRLDVDVISISDSDSSHKSESDWSSDEEEPPRKRATLSRPNRNDDPEIIALAQQMGEVLAFEASAAENATQYRSLDSLRLRQAQSRVVDWLDSSNNSSAHHLWSVAHKVIRTSEPRVVSRWHRDFSRWSGLRPSGSIWRAPGGPCSFSHVSRPEMIVIASAVAGGTVGDAAGPYNREGTLVVWFKREECWVEDQAHTLEAHSQETSPEPGQFVKQHFTVNNIAIDPSCPSRFASAGRDRRVLLWDCSSQQEGRPPEMVEEIKCQDNPEVIEYRPGESTLAIQCDNGSVYLHADGSTSALQIVRADRNHYTAGMVWGRNTSSNFLFASSASREDAKGRHKAFDVAHHRVVVEFDADKEACATLALDNTGERLFIATEGPETTYNLRQFDVRARLRKPVQTVALEPFVDIADKGAIDINALALSADGLYVAAARTDNWVDVYDARMLARGPLHSFAHEDSDVRKMYGVVKAEWMEGSPYGVGLVSGGADGCVRLWDVRRASDDPLNGTVLARGDNDVSTFTLGDMYQGEAPLIVGVCSGQVTVLDHTADAEEE